MNDLVAWSFCLLRAQLASQGRILAGVACAAGLQNVDRSTEPKETKRNNIGWKIFKSVKGGTGGVCHCS